MGIPAKDRTKVTPLGVIGRTIKSMFSSVPYVLKEIPNLPKLKLMKVTAGFMLLSFGVYFITGPYKRIIFMRYVQIF